LPRDEYGNYYSRRIDLTDREEVGERLLNARKGMQIGARLGSVVPVAGSLVGATLGGISGFILGDETTVFPLDMIAIPAYQAYMLNGTPAFQIFIKEGEVLTQVMKTDAQEAVEAVSDVQNDVKPKKRRRSKWNIYTAKKANQIRFKSGKKKGLLNLKAMGAAYRKANKGGKKK
jgi:hypothetical protein